MTLAGDHAIDLQQQEKQDEAFLQTASMEGAGSKKRRLLSEEMGALPLWPCGLRSELGWSQGDSRGLTSSC